MFLNLIVVKLINNKSIGHCGLGGVHLCKIIDYTAIRVLLLDIFIGEVHYLVAVRVDDFFDIVRKEDLDHTTHVSNLSFTIFFDFALDLSPPLGLVSMVLLGIVQTPLIKRRLYRRRLTGWEHQLLLLLLL